MMPFLGFKVKIFSDYLWQWRIQDFPEGAITPKGWRQHVIRAKFRENCMEMKRIGPKEGRASCRWATVATFD